MLTDSGRHHFPSPAEIPALMGDFTAWLGTARSAPDTAFTAHRRLVEIHPFDDGNGRTARLLMNLVLIRGGYSPVAVRLVERPAYMGQPWRVVRFGIPSITTNTTSKRMRWWWSIIKCIGSVGLCR